MSRSSEFCTLAWYYLTKGVPAGKVVTYKTLSTAVTGSGAASRAAGMAMATNPFAPVVPCHRVVRTDLTLGGYSGPSDGCSSLHFKRDFLRSEGVKFTATAPGAPFKVAPESILDVITVPKPAPAVLDAFAADMAAGHAEYLVRADTDVAKAFAKQHSERTAAAAASADAVAPGTKIAASAGGKKPSASPSAGKRTATAAVAAGTASALTDADAATGADVVAEVAFTAKRARVH